MKKCILISIVILVSVNFTGCELSVQNSDLVNSSVISTYEPSSLRLDLGEVTLLYGSNQTAVKHQDSILKAVSNRILLDRGVSIKFNVIADPNLIDRLDNLVASNDPPEICLSVPKDFKEDRKSFIYPLSLNDALEEYGLNLKGSIEKQYWDEVTVGNNVMAIPQLTTLTNVLVMNKVKAKNFGFTIPKTINEFESYLDIAKKENIVPYLTNGNYGCTQVWFGIIHNNDFILDNNEIVSIYESESYLKWLSCMRKWFDNGWTTSALKKGEYDTTIQNGNWLFREMSLDELKLTNGIEVIQPFSASFSGPICPPLIQIRNTYESYFRPEALVIFFDWIITSEQNNRLIAIGEEDIDYRMVDQKTYEWIDGPSWPGTDFFIMNPMFNNPSFPINNKEEFKNAIEYINKYQSNIKRIDVPRILRDYRINGGRLDKAWKKVSTFNNSEFYDSYRCLSGKITYNQYLENLSLNKPLILDYISLLEDYQSKHYDPLSEVIHP